MADESSAVGKLDRSNQERSYKPPFMPWMENDFWSFRVRLLPRIARLMYRSLLQQGWHSENPPCLPDDDQMLEEMADAPTHEIWLEHRDRLRKMFINKGDGWLYHDTAVKMYEKAAEKLRAQADGGRNKGKTKATSKLLGSKNEVSGNNQNQNQNQNQDTARTTTENSISTENGIPSIDGARGLCDRLQTFGREYLSVYQDVIDAEVKVGCTVPDVVDRMEREWRAYEAADLAYKKGAAKFFGSGEWKKWRGARPAKVPNLLDEIRADRARRAEA